MPKALHKVRKHIAKKKGQASALHIKSRDSRMLQRAGARDARLAKGATERRQMNEQYLLRCHFFQQALRRRRDGGRGSRLDLEAEDDGGHDHEDAMQTDTFPTSVPLPVLNLPDIQALIRTLLTRHENALSTLQSERRPGRPPSPKEATLKRQMEAERKEYESGFWVPDVRDRETVDRLGQWQGGWTGLGMLGFVRVSRGGDVKASMFPPKGMS